MQEASTTDNTSSIADPTAERREEAGQEGAQEEDEEQTALLKYKTDIYQYLSGQSISAAREFATKYHMVSQENIDKADNKYKQQLADYIIFHTLEEKSLRRQVENEIAVAKWYDALQCGGGGQSLLAKGYKKKLKSRRRKSKKKKSKTRLRRRRSGTRKRRR